MSNTHIKYKSMRIMNGLDPMPLSQDVCACGSMGTSIKFDKIRKGQNQNSCFDFALFLLLQFQLLK